MRKSYSRKAWACGKHDLTFIYKDGSGCFAESRLQGGEGRGQGEVTVTAWMVEDGDLDTSSSSGSDDAPYTLPLTEIETDGGRIPDYIEDIEV